MTVQQYVKKIKSLCTAENSNQTDLDNLATKISWDNNKAYFNLFDLEFINNQKRGNHEIINMLEDYLGLQFISKKEPEGSVCFINSYELRPEFRQSFTIIDLLDYCHAVLHSAINEISEINSTRIPVTLNSSVFWQFVKHGSELRKEDIY